MALSRQERIAARHVVDSSSRQLATSIVLRRHIWLCSTTLRDDLRLHIENMPFDGLGLFDVKTDTVLNEHQKMKKTAKTYSSQFSYRPFKQPWRKPFYPQYRPYHSFHFNADRNRQSIPTNAPAARQQANRRPKQPFRRQDRRGKQGF